jgi:putative ABC transport system ATP-binding protein
MDGVLIKLENIKKIFHTEEVETHALSNVSLNINKGEFVSISGPSGCGKSTLLTLLGLLDTASEGTYVLAGHDVSAIPKGERARIRNKEIGFVFQSFNLISDLDVEENVELPLTYRAELNKSQRKQMVKDALEKVDMSHRAKHFPSQLSGGQQQRVAVARAIAGNPSVLLADEPTGNLDTKNAETVMQLLEKLHMEGATICMVTHDPRSASRADRRIDLLDGRIVSDKTVATRKPAEARAPAEGSLA